MTVQMEHPVAPARPADEQHDLTGFDLDITIVEGGPAADQLIRLTNDFPVKCLCSPEP